MGHQVAFSRVTKQEVLGTLKAAGTSDPDVLFATKEGIAAASRPLKFMGIIPIVCGIGMTLTIIGAVIGIPMMILGFWMRHRGKSNVKTIEVTFSESLKGAGAAAGRGEPALSA
jgi:hypothetical protein